MNEREFLEALSEEVLCSDHGRHALTHRSASGAHNERLEFLGDALLNLIIAEALYSSRPEADEGELRGQLGALLRCFPQQTHPTALELSQVCIGLPRSLSSQCHLSSSSSLTTDCHFDGPTRRTHRQLQR